MAEKYYVDLVDGVEIYRKSRRFVKKVVLDKIGAANGIAPLDGNSLIPSQYLPSYVDDAVEGYLDIADATAFTTTDAYAKGDLVKYNSKVWRFTTAHAAGAWNSNQVEEIPEFPTTGETSKIYVDLLTEKTYRWSGSVYVEISKSLALGETSNTAYRGDRGKAAYDHAQDSTHSTAVTEKLYKVAITAKGHIASETEVTKAHLLTYLDSNNKPLEDSANKVTSWGTNDANATDTNYPSAKLVKDSLDGVTADAPAINVFGVNSSAKTNNCSNQSNPYLNLVQGTGNNAQVKSSLQIKAGTNMSVKADGDELTITNTFTQDPHHVSRNVVGGSASATANAQVTASTGVYLNHVEKNSSNVDTVTSSHKIIGDGEMVKVTSDSSGNITISGKTATKLNMGDAIDEFDTAYDAAYASTSGTDEQKDAAGNLAGWAAVDAFIQDLDS